jgi:hypothetical protein
MLVTRNTIPFAASVNSEYNVFPTVWCYRRIDLVPEFKQATTVA